MFNNVCLRLQKYSTKQRIKARTSYQKQGGSKNIVLNVVSKNAPETIYIKWNTDIKLILFIFFKNYLISADTLRGSQISWEKH